MEIIEDNLSRGKYKYTNGWNDAIDRVWDWITEETEVEMHGVHWDELEKEIMKLKIPYFRFGEE